MNGSIEIRRIQATRHGTFLVSLPKDWARRFNLQKGSPIYVKERTDGCLILDPQYEAEGYPEITIKLSKRIEDHIVSSYLLGYELITVEGLEGFKAERERIRRTASRLVGVEIVEEDENRMVLQCLLKATAIPPERILRRQYVLSRSLCEEAFAALLNLDVKTAEKLRGKDDEVDRLYFLLVRLLRSLIINPRLSEKLKISLIECLDYRLAASLMENMADTAVEVAELTGRVKIKGGNVRLLLGRLEDFSQALTLAYDEAVKALFSKDEKFMESSSKHMGEALEILRIIGEEASKYNAPPTIYILLTLLGRLVNHIKDIADLVAPHQISG
jgi:phosphate uptake regulator